MKYALIGCGRIAVNHIKAAQNNQLDIVAVCDIDLSQTEKLLEIYGLEKNLSIKRYTDYQKMLEENQLDLVAIATESGKHAEIALFCINNGIHCIIEKPIAMSIQDADKIIQQAEEKM